MFFFLKYIKFKYVNSPSIASYVVFTNLVYIRQRRGYKTFSGVEEKILMPPPLPLVKRQIEADLNMDELSIGAVNVCNRCIVQIELLKITTYDG